MKKRQPLVTRKAVEEDGNSKRRGVRYGQCQRNHAAKVGGYALDGCREFIASGEDGTRAAVECAACHCHRSFHKRHEEPSEDWSESSSSSNK